MIVGAGIFTAVALLPYAELRHSPIWVCSILILRSASRKCPHFHVLRECSLRRLSGGVRRLSIRFSFFRVSGCQITLLLAYLAGIDESEAIMFFSPTMYASGARVYYLTDLLYLFVILCLAFGLKEERRRNILYAVCAGFGVLNFVCQLPAFSCGALRMILEIIEF